MKEKIYDVCWKYPEGHIGYADVVSTSKEKAWKKLKKELPKGCEFVGIVGWYEVSDV
jgi:hypothetical protein